MDKDNKKKIIEKYRNPLSSLYRFLKHNRYKIEKGNRLCINGVFASDCSFNVVGNQNTIIIDPGITRISNCIFTIHGDNNFIHIGKDSNLRDTIFFIEDNNGKIEIGNHVTIVGKTELAVIEGRCITIGDDCLFSSDINFRVGDSHSILDFSTGARINPSLDIMVANHVWIGHSVKVLKGASIGSNSIIATGAIVPGKEYPAHCIIGGIPAKILKENVDWTHRRII